MIKKMKKKLKTNLNKVCEAEDTAIPAIRYLKPKFLAYPVLPINTRLAHKSTEEEEDE
jgi:hypothetical protein